jgi:hypothetical protein
MISMAYSLISPGVTGWGAVVIDRRPVAGERELKGAIGRRLLHHVLDGSMEARQKGISR